MIRGSVRRRVPVALSLIVAAAGLAGTSVPAAAGVACAVRNVTDATDFSDVQSAVNASSKGDRIEVRGSCQGPVVINKTITLVGMTISGYKPGIYGQESVRPVEVAAGRTVTIKRLLIAYGFSDTAGGGIWNRGTLTLTDVEVFENDATIGGGILNDGTLVIGGASRVRDNRATDNGGGIFSRGPLTIGGTAVVADNHAASEGGGVFHIGGTGDRPLLTIRDQAVVRGNEATRGFGIVVRETGALFRDRASVRGNRQDGGEGEGAVYLTGGRLTMTGHASVRGNIGGFVGGIVGDDRDRTSAVTMKGSSVVRANVGSVGGIYLEDGPLLMIDTSSVRDHTAPGTQSAVVVRSIDEANTGAFTMRNGSRVTDNDVEAGWAAVVRIWCSGLSKAVYTGLSGRVTGNTPQNVKTLCP